MATTDLGKWMITNGGDYDPDVTYEKLTMVMYDNSTYITLKTVTGVTPSNDQINYALMARGFNPGVLSSVTAVDTSGALGTAGETVSAQSLVDYLADAVMTKLVEKANISNVQINDSSKVPSAALAYAMQQQITENENAISVLNSDMEIEILTSSDSILEFIANNKRAKQGFVTESGYPTDAPENIEAFVIVNRDQTGNRVLVEFRPYGFATRNYSYFRSAFNGEWQQPEWTKMDLDSDPVYKVLNLTSQFDPLGSSYSLKTGGFVYIHLGFMTTRQPSEGDDIVQLIDTGDIAPVSNVAFTSRQGGYATFKIDPGSKNLRIGGTPPKANHTFVIDAIFKLN